MSPEGSPNTNSGAGSIEARKAKLLKNQRERQLSDVFEKFFPFQQERHILEYYEFEEWASFFSKFSEVIKTLLSINPFENNQELKKECEEVLPFLLDKDRSQSNKYADLISKLSEFFFKKKVFIQSKLP